MSELPPTYEKDYLDLLYDYHSDETKKTRRNLTVASFLVVSAHLIGIPVTEIKFLGVDPTHGDIRVISVIYALLLVFWYLMFVVHSLHDYHIQKERQHLLHKHIRMLFDELEECKKTLDTRKANMYARHAALDRKYALSHQIGIFRLQQKRTKWAIALSRLIKLMEYTLPLIFGATAISYLVRYF